MASLRMRALRGVHRATPLLTARRLDEMACSPRYRSVLWHRDGGQAQARRAPSICGWTVAWSRASVGPSRSGAPTRVIASTAGSMRVHVSYLLYRAVRISLPWLAPSSRALPCAIPPRRPAACKICIHLSTLHACPRSRSLSTSRASPSGDQERIRSRNPPNLHWIYCSCLRHDSHWHEGRG